MNEELAYLLGSYFGDGHVYYKNYSYQFILVSEDEDFLINNAFICQKFFENSGTITPVKNHYKLVVCNKELCNYILDHMCTNVDYNVADKLEKKGKLPKLPDYENIVSFIRGVMDSDGWISKRKNGKYWKYEVGFKNTSLLSPEIYDLMISIGLKCTKLNLREGQETFRNGKKYKKNKSRWDWYINPLSYCSLVRFNIIRKNKLVEEYLSERGYVKT